MAGRPRQTKRTATPKKSGGEGGTAPSGEPSPEVLKSVNEAVASVLSDAWDATTRPRKNLKLMAAAAGFPITPEVRQAMVLSATEYLKHPKARVRIAANRTLAVLAAQNQSDRHLKARMENSGVALVEARRTLETMPDGSTRETQAVKLWGVKAPVEDV